MALDVQGVDYLKLPVGTTAQRPAVPATGMTRQNSTTGVPEWYDSTSASWVQFSQQTSSSPNTFGFKNRIINGAMVIDQRNAGASGTAVDIYTVDRWKYQASQASKGTWQQNAGSVTPPAGFTNYLGFTSSSAYSVISTDEFTFNQYIEGFNTADLGWGTANAQTVTLSFWVRSSLTGTFGGALKNSASNRGYPFSYTISAANTWEYKTVVVVGDTAGTWNTTSSTGVQVDFGLGVGSSYSGTAGSWQAGYFGSSTGATSVVGTNGATFYITGIQLEVGSIASQFDFRDYGRELILCQRYYQKYTGLLLSGYNSSGGSIYNTYLFPVEMRATPTMNYSGFTNSNCNDAATNSTSTKTWRTQAIITSTGSGFSIFSADTSGAEL